MINRKTIEIKYNILFFMLSKIGRMVNMIPKIEMIKEKFVDFLIPTRIASVFTPWFLSPSISSHPFIISLETKPKNDAKKKKKINDGIIKLFNTAP